MSLFDEMLAWRCPNCDMLAESRALFMREFQPHRARKMGLTGSCLNCKAQLLLEVPMSRNVVLFGGLVAFLMTAQLGGYGLAIGLLGIWVALNIFVHRKIPVKATLQ